MQLLQHCCTAVLNVLLSSNVVLIWFLCWCVLNDRNFGSLGRAARESKRKMWDLKKNSMQQETWLSGARVVGLKLPVYIRPSLLTAQCSRSVSDCFVYYMVSHNCACPFSFLRANEGPCCFLSGISMAFALLYRLYIAHDDCQDSVL